MLLFRGDRSRANLFVSVGAGAAGATNAYNLHKYADSLHIPINITVFERASYIGGRSTTVNVFDDPAYPVEVGGSIFVDVNYNLVNATKELGLTTRDFETSGSKKSAEDEVGIWDGKRFVFTIDDSLDWRTMAKLVLKYGLAPLRTRNLVQKTLAKFLKFYDEPIFPFKSLTDAVAKVGLLDATSLPGSVFLESNDVSSGFSRDIIQSSTRVNYGQNLPLIHGLGAITCMSTENAIAIKGGNWLIFDGMLRAAGADVKLNQTVTSIERNPDGTLTVTSVPSNSKEESSVFDEVVIAAPLQYSDISISPPLDHSPNKEPTPFVTLHVTLFSSPHKLSPKFFNLKPTDEVPGTVLTTLPRGLDLGSSQDGVGPAGFWSISTLTTVTSPSPDNQKQYVYKIFSPERPTTEFVARILDVQDSFDAAGNSNSTIGDLPKRDISWFHEKTWHPYPFLYPRRTFDEIILSPNIWYTGGIEAFISTMETSALMGRNVAALIFGSWQDYKVGGVGSEGDSVKVEL